MTLMQQHSGGGGRESSSSFPQQSRRTGRLDADSKQMRSAKTSMSRGVTRSATNSKHGNDRPEHPLSSLSRLAAEEAAAASGGGDVLGTTASRLGAGAGAGGVGGGHRRILSDMGSSHGDGVDRRLSHNRDPLRRSRDTAVSDTPSLAERGGHGRDGPIIPRDPAISTNAGGAGGGNASRPGGGGGGVERERTAPVFKVGEEELPMEVPGRYEKMRVLGRGSFGAVTLVKDHRDSKLYAMKTLNCADKLEERVTAMAEVRLLKWLKHPCVLTLFDVFLSADSRLVCLTTTYCESGDLAKIVKHASKTKSPLGEKTVLGWFAQLCLGVHNLHEEKKVLHRDIKPNNVFLMDSKKIVQLGDFGLAKVINDGDKQVKAEVGTPYYTSPEMCNNQPYGFPSDVWSLGIVLYELLSLDVPFRSRDVVALVSQVIKAPPPPLPEVYSDEVTALARWMLQKDPLRRPTLTQALACQPLRRHMSSFVKHYRPMNMAERQRRHDIKDLEAQVASIIEHGGDDPQIPRDVTDGCGTLPAGTQDETATDTLNRADSKSHPGEARGGSAEGFEGAAAVLMEIAAGGGEGGLAAVAAAGRTRTADRNSVRSPSAISITADGVPVAERADEDENAAARAAANGGGGCPRCGARVPCACGGGRGGGGGGGGNATPGRRFGSPQQSKGLRNVMSWATGGSITPPAGRGSEGDDGDSQDGSRSGIDVNRDGIERRRRSTDYEKGTTEWHSASSGGSVKSFSSAESFNKSSSSHGSRWRDRRKTGDGGKKSSSSPRDSGASIVGNGGDRKRSSRGTGFQKSEEGSDGVDGGGDHETESADRSDNSLTAPARPKSPRSPRAHRSTRLKRVSGSSSAEASGCPNGGESEGEGMAAAVAAATTEDSDSMRRRGSSNTGVTDKGYEDKGKGTPRLAPSQPPGVDDESTAVSAPPDTTEPNAVLHEAPPTEAGTAPTRRRQGDGAETEVSSKGTCPGSPHLVAVEGGASEKGIRQSGSSTSPAIRRSSTAAAAIALDRLALTPRTPRSPRIVGSDSEPFKSAKRLSEALMFAASSSEEDFLTGTATAAAGSTGHTPRRESGALGGPLAIVEEAKSVREGMTIGRRAAEGRGNPAAALGAPS
ncbi:unnamed protein product [Ectocarpus sp. 13 AM-2016]